jgi:hypothetical protein
MAMHFILNRRPCEVHNDSPQNLGEEDILCHAFPEKRKEFDPVLL